MLWRVGLVVVADIFSGGQWLDLSVMTSSSFRSLFFFLTRNARHPIAPSCYPRPRTAHMEARATAPTAPIPCPHCPHCPCCPSPMYGFCFTLSIYSTCPRDHVATIGLAPSCSPALVYPLAPSPCTAAKQAQTQAMPSMSLQGHSKGSKAVVLGKLDPGRRHPHAAPVPKVIHGRVMLTS